MDFTRDIRAAVGEESERKDLKFGKSARSTMGNERNALWMVVKNGAVNF